MNHNRQPGTRAGRVGSGLRTAGTLILLIGVGGAAILYLVRTRANAWAEDPMLADFSKADTRQMEMLYGKMGLMISDFMTDLKRPGTQAFLIVVGSLIAASCCFLMARRKEENEEMD